MSKNDAGGLFFCVGGHENETKENKKQNERQPQTTTNEKGKERDVLLDVGNVWEEWGAGEITKKNIEGER
jgi:hypothetical protein